MDDGEVEEALDDLFARSPEDFVNARNALTRRLKAGGRRDDAARVAQWRRPGRTAWALNRLGQTEPGVVATLVAASGAVRDEQATGGPALREAMAGLRQTTRQAADAAVAAIAPARPSDHADISAALLAVLSDGEALDLLAQGRLLAIPESGFGALALGPPHVPTSPSGKTAAGPKRGPAVRRGDHERAQREEREAALRKAGEARSRARAAHEGAAAAAEDAAATVHDAEERLARARAVVRDEEAAVAEATGALEAARSSAEVAHQGLVAAEQALSNLERATE